MIQNLYRKFISILQGSKYRQLSEMSCPHNIQVTQRTKKMVFWELLKFQEWLFLQAHSNFIRRPLYCPETQQYWTGNRGNPEIYYLFKAV